MDNEVIEAVSRCRMDIQELKGMMKMHFKDEVHHHHPCKELEHERSENRINGFFVCLLCVCFIICSISSRVTSNEIERLEEQQKRQLEFLHANAMSNHESFMDHKQAITNMMDVYNRNFGGMMDIIENHIKEGH